MFTFTSFKENGFYSGSRTKCWTLLGIVTKNKLVPNLKSWFPAGTKGYVPLTSLTSVVTRIFLFGRLCFTAWRSNTHDHATTILVSLLCWRCSTTYIISVTVSNCLPTKHSYSLWQAYLIIIINWKLSVRQAWLKIPVTLGVLVRNKEWNTTALPLLRPDTGESIHKYWKINK